MALQLSTNFLPGSLASGFCSDLHCHSSSNRGVRQNQHRFSCLNAISKASCRSTDEQEVGTSWFEYTPTRRHLLELAGAGAAFIIPQLSSARAETVKRITNIEDARIAGEKAREIKEAADGPVIVSSSGIKYRELERGVGKPISPGDYVSVYYTISRLNGYYLDSMGYGKEGKNDVGEALTFQYGKGMVPEAVEGGMEGMQVGAKRRILVTPERGWVRPELLPQPTSFFAERRLEQRRNSQALLIEVELVKAKPSNEQ
jgi:FKBP-type peptidyl-prolyl cis-trans isomerase FkpA